MVAKKQTKSRGRGTKIWQSCLGNLNFSILLKHNIDLNYLPQLSFVTAVALYKAVSTLPTKSPNNIQLKWPNDLLINNKKVAGILLESITISNNHYLVIGIGINIKQTPINVDQLTTSLFNENIIVEGWRNLLDLIIDNFDKYSLLWKLQGFNKIKQYWMKRAYNLNQIITVNYHNTQITGIFIGIDQNGQMEVILDSGEIIKLVA